MEKAEIERKKLEKRMRSRQKKKNEALNNKDVKNLASEKDMNLKQFIEVK